MTLNNWNFRVDTNRRKPLSNTIDIAIVRTVPVQSRHTSHPKQGEKSYSCQLSFLKAWFLLHYFHIVPLRFNFLHPIENLLWYDFDLHIVFNISVNKLLQTNFLSRMHFHWKIFKLTHFHLYLIPSSNVDSE